MTPSIGSMRWASARAQQATTGSAPARLVGLLLFVCVLAGYLLSYNVDQPSHNGDWFLRYQVTCSIVEHNSFAITPYQRDNRTGPGLQHQTYTQYTLGQTTAMIPLYLLGRRLAGLAHTNCASPIAPAIVLLTCKLLGPILGALLAALFYATARLLRYPRRIALGLTLLLAFGTALWPDVQSNLEHTMESLFVLTAAYAALRYTISLRPQARVHGGRTRTPVESEGARSGTQPAGIRGQAVRRLLLMLLHAGRDLTGPGEGQRLWLLVMGLAAGLVFVTRVAGVFVPVLFALYLLVLWRRRAPRDWLHPWRRDLASFVIGVLPSFLVNAAFDAARFGNPLQTEPHGDASFGYPPWLGLPDLLVSPGKGLLWYVPALALLALAARPFWRRFPLAARLFALIVGGYLLFYANVNYWHGDPAWGPRYLYATLPYLVLPLGEVFGRWRGYRRAQRAALVGILAASFLVQFSAVSVSYWRSFHYVFATYPDQVQHYSWGFDLNNFWEPGQSPLLLALGSVADITRMDVEGTPLVQHSAAEHLGSGNESCIFTVYHRITLCLTDVDDLRHRASFNTFTLWWMHTFPWWPRSTVIGLAAALLAVLLASGGALVRLTASGQLPVPAVPPWTAASDTDRRRGPSHAAPRGHAIVRAIAPIDAHPGHVPPPAGAPSSGQSAALNAAPAAVAAPVSKGASGLGPLADAALAATLVYGGLAAIGLASASHRAAPLVRTSTVGRLVVDGELAYRVLGVTRLRITGAVFRVTPREAELAGLHPFEGAEYGDYAVVRLWLHNLSPTRWHSIRRANFTLADPAGDTMYPWPCSTTSAAASSIGRAGRRETATARRAAGARQELPSCPQVQAGSFVDPAILIALFYHSSPAWYALPPHGAADRLLVYAIPTTVRHVALLGPGITLTRLDIATTLVLPRGVITLGRRRDNATEIT